MIQTKCITLLRSLSNKELNDFEFYLKALYQGKEREIHLFDYLKKCTPRFNPSQLSIEYALANGLSNKGFNHALLSSKLSALFKLLEEYLIWKKIQRQRNSLSIENLLIDIYQERGIENLYIKKVQALTKSIKDEDKKNMQSFSNLMQLESRSYFHKSTFKKKVKGNELKNIMENIDGFYIAAKLKYSCELMFTNKITGRSLHSNLIKETINLSTQTAYNDNKLFEICRLVMELEETPNEEKYQYLKKLIKENVHKEVEQDQSIYFGFLLNYIAGEIKKGKINYGLEAAEWINHGLDTKVIFDKGFLHPTVFLNFVNIACSIGNLELANKIFNEQSKNIRKEFKKKTVKIAKAYIAFKNKKFDVVLKLIKPESFPEKIMDLKARVIILQSLYETKEIDTLINFFDAFNKSIRRTNDLGVTNKKSASNLIKYTKKLLDPNIDNHSLLQEINDLDKIFSKMWLLKKIETR